MTTETIGSALVARRQKLGIDKGQAADKIGMSRTTYSSYEQDKQRPSVDVFPALAHFLEVGIEDFLLLYGATAIVAVRPALEGVLFAQQNPSATDAPVASTATDHESDSIALPTSWSVTNDESDSDKPANSTATDDDFESDTPANSSLDDEEFETDESASSLEEDDELEADTPASPTATDDDFESDTPATSSLDDEEFETDAPGARLNVQVSKKTAKGKKKKKKHGKK